MNDEEMMSKRKPIPGGEEFGTPLTTMQAEIGDLRHALRRIEGGGGIPNASALAISGDWKSLYYGLQKIAREALEK